VAKHPKTVHLRKRDENRIVIPHDPTRPVARGHEYGLGRASTAHRDKRQRREKTRLRRELRDW